MKLFCRDKKDGLKLSTPNFPSYVLLDLFSFFLAGSLPSSHSVKHCRQEEVYCQFVLPVIRVYYFLKIALQSRTKSYINDDLSPTHLSIYLLILMIVCKRG